MDNKLSYLLPFILLIGGVLFSLITHKRKPNDAGRQRGAAPDHTQTDNFNDLRAMAFRMTPEQLHLSLPADLTTVYGVIMERGGGTDTVTIVSYQTGDAGIYLRFGGSVIGGGQHQHVSDAAKQLVGSAQQYLGKATEMETNALPQRDEVKFYLLTNKGIFAGHDRMENFENRSSAWLSLYEEAKKVLTELRVASGSMK